MTRVEELENFLRLLVNFGGVVSKETNLTKLLGLIAEQVKTILVCDRCSVFILDRDQRALVKVAGCSTRDPRAFGKGIVGHVAPDH